MSEVGTPVRTSNRKGKGIPPTRLGFEDEMSNIPRTPPTADNASTSSGIPGNGTSNRNNLVNVADNANSSSTATASADGKEHGGTKQKTQNSEVQQLTLQFNRKITEMQNQFQRQLHEMNRMQANNSMQLQSTIQALQAALTARETTDTNTNSNTEQLQNGESGSQPSGSQQSSNSQQWVYTKTVDLPKFSGNPIDWPMFERSFEDTTREFCYTHTRNIIRLRDALHGDAKIAVDALLPYPDSVPEIMETLKENFGRPEQIINTQIVEIRKIATIPSGNLNLIVPFANRVKNMTAFIRYANAEHRLSDSTLLSELVAKLPVEKQLDWAEYKEKLPRYANIEHFSNFLNIVAKRANSVADSLPKAAVAQREARNNNNRYQENNTNPRRRVLIAATYEKCIVCSDNCAKLSNCPVFEKMSNSERWSKVKSLRLCFSCLKKGHSIAKCHAKNKCSVDKCEKVHNSLLHNMEMSTQQKQQQRAEASTVQVEKVYSADANRENSDVLYQVMPVTVTAGNIKVNTYGFVDQGASHSMIEWDLADQLGLTGRNDTLSLQWLGNVTSTNPTKLVSFKILGNGDHCKTLEMLNVYTVRNMNLPIQSLDTKTLPQDTSKHFKNLPLVSYRDAKPQIVIGLDYAHLTAALETPIITTNTGPIITKTPLGWLVHGRINYFGFSSNNRVLFTKSNRKERLDDLENLVKEYFAYESFGIENTTQQVLSNDDQHAINIMETTTRRIGERYEVGMLWAPSFKSFPESYNTAKRRLELLEKQMQRDNELATEYHAKINDYLNKGYARKLSKEEAAEMSPKVFYLPHFAVRNPNKKGIRIVFDAAAEVNGMSLNKALVSGPDINQPLLKILFKFRQSPIAVCGDIREMFLQVAIRKEDQDCQRFLWRSGNSIETYVMMRMTFGATCSPTLAQHVKNTNAKAFNEQWPRAVVGVAERHYVDDYVDCFENEEEACDVLPQVIAIQKSAGFELRNIVSNSEKVLQKIGCNMVKDQTNVINVECDKIERILGMHWSTSTDNLFFVLKFHRVSKDILSGQRKPSKREILSLNMSIFDPFGILSNFLISSKIILQKLWMLGLGWDEEVPGSIFEEWALWLAELPKVEKVFLPRCYHPKLMTENVVELHIFADASESALAVVAYWRITVREVTSIHFIAAKTKCAPLRQQSIPRLELQAAVMAVRLKNTIISNHNVKINQVWYWSDSTTVIQWIRSDTRRYKQFVANRITEILENSNLNEWRWLPSKQNVADEGTRPKYPPCFEPNGRWIRGPDFLLKNCEEWPIQPQNNSKEDVAELRVKRHILLAESVKYLKIDFEHFSNYYRLRRSVAWMQRFIKNCQASVAKKPLVKTCLTADEEEQAERILCRMVQMEVFSSEYANLLKNNPIANDSSLRQLNPYIDDHGVMRLSGRIENAPFISVAAKRPILLPKKHPFTNLLISWYHCKWRHINVLLIINEVRQKFWIPSLPTLMKRVAAKCNFCKIKNAKTTQPIMGLLPRDRLTPYVRPFTYSGVDFFGPVIVTVRRQREKRWVALFTCLTTRAIHLEIAADLSSDACLVCIRNFVNRRGVPLQIRSDNGTNFVGLQKELRGEQNFIDHQAIQSNLSPLGIRWKFNCPSNPSAGGVWERLVQSVKKVLCVVLKEVAPRVETLNSFLIEAENIVNSRPLTHIPVTPDEAEPLTPNHFLLNTTNSTQTPTPYDPKLLCMRKQWRIAQTMKNGFWKQWLLEYLPELTRRTKWCRQSKAPAVNDLVLICDTDSPRSQWKRGRIKKLYYGKDNVARFADIETSHNVMRRPISKMAILDVVED